MGSSLKTHKFPKYPLTHCSEFSIKLSTVVWEEFWGVEDIIVHYKKNQGVHL